MDEPENTNVFRYISKWGFGVYNWKLDDDVKVVHEYQTQK